MEQLALELQEARTAMASGNGDGAILFVAYRDTGAGMTPAAIDGRLAVFDDLNEARASAGALGVAAPVHRARLVELCRQHNLGLPARGRRGEP